MSSSVNKITLRVYDVPRPGGSKTPRFNPKTGKSFVQPANQHTITWREAVKTVALAKRFRFPDGTLLKCSMDFIFNRPKAHYRTGKNSHLLKEDAPHYHGKAPDTTKLVRSTEDALTGIIWDDDSRVVVQHNQKFYANELVKQGAIITIERVE